MYIRRTTRAKGTYARPNNSTNLKSPCARIAFPKDLFLRLAEEAARRLGDAALGAEAAERLFAKADEPELPPPRVVAPLVARRTGRVVASVLLAAVRVAARATDDQRRAARGGAGSRTAPFLFQLSSDSSDALPPALVVSMLVVRSAQKRCR